MVLYNKKGVYTFYDLNFLFLLKISLNKDEKFFVFSVLFLHRYNK